MSEVLSVSHKGNQKLGPKISVLNRAVGDSCPSACEFLENGCYAQKSEVRFPKVRSARLRNMRLLDWQKIRSFLLEAKKKGNTVRLHESGDFLKTTLYGTKRLDRRYIGALTKAILSIEDPPPIYVYSHVYRQEVSSLARLGISVFASVGTQKDCDKAKKAGFTKFAWSTDLRKGKDKDKVWITECGDVVPVCWEHLPGGKKKSTCSDCGYCLKPNLGSIAFMMH